MSCMLTGRLLFVTDVNRTYFCFIIAANGTLLLSLLLTGRFCPVAAVNRTSFAPTMLNTGRL